MPENEKIYTENELTKRAKEAYESGLKHQSSSPQTLDLINKLEKAMELKFDKFENSFNSKLEKLENKIDNLPTRIEIELSNEKICEKIFQQVKNEYVSKNIFETAIKNVYREIKPFTKIKEYLGLAFIIILIVGVILFILSNGQEIFNKLSL